MAKRGNGEGSIYQRKGDGRWVGIIHLGWNERGRVRKYVYGSTRKEVAEKLNVLLNDQQRNKPIRSNERQTVAAFLDDWLEHAKDSLKPSTYASYSAYVRTHLVPRLGRVQLIKLTPQQVEACLAEMRAAGLSPRSQAHARTVLRTALNQALRWDLVTRNAAALARPPRVGAKAMTVLSVAQARDFVVGVKGLREEALYLLALSCGLRLGEVTGLRWDDIDLETDSIQVRQALQRGRGEFRLVEPKSQTSRRRVALPPLAVAALKAHQQAQEAERDAAGSSWSNEWDLLFTTPFGRPLNPSSLTRRFRSVLTKLGLPQMRFHDLRHSCASLLIAQGVHPRVVMETLGHSQISLTMNTYSHILPEVAHVAASSMEALLQPADGSEDGRS